MQHRLLPRTCVTLLPHKLPSLLPSPAPNVSPLSASLRGFHSTIADCAGKKERNEGGKIHLFGQHDEDLGIMRKAAAEKFADEKHLKLVVIDDTKEQHQVYRLMTGRQLMAEQKALRLLKKALKPKELKTLRVSSSISEHDLAIKKRHLVEWLEKSHEVKVIIKKAHRGGDQAGADVFQKLTDSVKGLATVKHSKTTKAELVLQLKPVSKPDAGDKQSPMKMDELKKSVEN